MHVNEKSGGDNKNGGNKSLFQRLRQFLSNSFFPAGNFLPKNGSVIKSMLLSYGIFAVLIFVCFLLVRPIIIKQTETKNKYVFFSTYHYFNAAFNNFETLVENLAMEVELAVADEKSVEEIHEYLKLISAHLNLADRDVNPDICRLFIKGQLHNEFEYIGPFCELFGQRIDGVASPLPEHDDHTQPWGTEVKEGNGKLVYPNMLATLYRDDYVAGLGRALYCADKEGERELIGTLGIVVDADQMNRLVHAFLPTSNVYTTLINPHGQVVVSSDSQLIGKYLSKTSQSGEEIMAERDQLSEDPFNPTTFVRVNANGVRCVGYSGLLPNGWIVISAIPIQAYNRQVQLVGVIFVLLGIGMAWIFGFLLTRLYYEKQQADIQNRSKSMFLAKMSHEIRTPLNVIAGLSRIIVREKKSLPPKIAAYASEVLHATDNLLAIINDILDLSKIESGKLEISKVSFTLSSLVEDIINIFRAHVADKGLQFTTFVNSQLPNNLIGDVVHIRKILLNLLGNAVKYTKQGHIAFDVLGAKTSEKAISISFIVRDTGIGIKREDQGNLFIEFSQVEKRSNWNIEGSGLGLSICKELVGKLNGSISLVSQYGHGTIFTVNLPIEIENDLPYTSVRDAAAHHVLIYEPRAVYEHSLMRTLTHLGVPNERIANVADLHKKLQSNKSISFIFAASHVYDEIAQLLESPSFANIQVVVLCEGHEQPLYTDVWSMIFPVNALHVAKLLNDESNVLGEESVSGATFIMNTARILVVDDSSSNFLVVEGLMAHYQCQIDFAMSGYEALQLVQQQHYDLIFMDHMMPKMDGVETTMRIRQLATGKERNPYFATVPIVALTANAVLGMRDFFLQNGMNGFLAKPIVPEHLHEILVTWIPKEKQQMPSNTHKSTILTSANNTIQIPGVNTRVGITQTGGTVEGYLRVIAALCSELETKVGVMEQALENNDLPLYKIQAHSYKSFLATIGVMPLSVTAAMLEISAQNEDRATIDAYHTGFVADLRKVAASVAAVLDAKAKKMGTTVVSSRDKDLLNAELVRLKTAISEKNMQQIDQAMERLRKMQWTNDVSECLEKIDKLVILFEWSEAIKQIDQLLGNEP